MDTIRGSCNKVLDHSTQHESASLHQEKEREEERKRKRNARIRERISNQLLMETIIELQGNQLPFHNPRAILNWNPHSSSASQHPLRTYTSHHHRPLHSMKPQAQALIAHTRKSIGRCCTSGAITSDSTSSPTGCTKNTERIEGSKKVGWGCRSSIGGAYIMKR